MKRKTMKLERLNPCSFPLMEIMTTRNKRLFWMLCTVVVTCMPRFSMGQRVFNPMDYEALGDGVSDDGLALADAWRAACENQLGGSVFEVPEGTTFLSGAVSFEGPCYNKISPKVRILGTLKAPTSLSGFHEPAWIEFKRLDQLEISGGGTLDAQGATTWNGTACPNNMHMPCKNPPMSLRLLKISNSTVTNLTFLDSKGFHIGIQRSSAVALHHLNISAPGDSPNTDGIHISNSDHVNVTRVTIGSGDDCISIGPGSTNISIRDVYCGPGHGISIGSLGKYLNESDVTEVHVKNCTISGTSNGVRIKTWPGSPASQAVNVTFEDIVMNNVSNPIIIDQEYCPDTECPAKPPSLVKVQNVTYKRIRGTTNDEVAVNLACSKIVPCEGVQFQDIHLDFIGEGRASNATSSCSNAAVVASGTLKPMPCHSTTSPDDEQVSPPPVVALNATGRLSSPPPLVNLPGMAAGLSSPPAANATTTPGLSSPPPGSAGRSSPTPATTPNSTDGLSSSPSTINVGSAGDLGPPPPSIVPRATAGQSSPPPTSMPRNASLSSPPPTSIPRNASLSSPPTSIPRNASLSSPPPTSIPRNASLSSPPPTIAPSTADLPPPPPPAVLSNAAGVSSSPPAVAPRANDSEL